MTIAVLELVQVTNQIILKDADLLASFVTAGQAAAGVAAAQAGLATSQAVIAGSHATAAGLSAAAAQVASPIYVTPAAGLAAVAADAYFSVVGTGNAFLILYRKTGGLAVEQGRYPSLASLDAFIPDKILRTPFRTIPAFVSGVLSGVKLFAVKGFGPGAVDHNIDIYYSFLAAYSQFGAVIGDSVADRYVSWATGDDATGTGRGDAPWKTVKKAMQSGLGAIWLLSDSQEVLDIEGTDNTTAGGTVPRAVIIKPLNGRVRFTSPGTLASTAVWTETAAGSTIWSMPNAGGKRVETILYAPDGDIANGRVVPFHGTGANAVDAAGKAGTAFDGWSQVGASGGVFLRFRRSLNIEANKAHFHIVYASPGHIIRGARMYIEGVDFIGGGDEIGDGDGSGGSGFRTPDSTVNATFKTRLSMKDCTVRFMSDKGLKPNAAAHVLLQNCDISRNSGDGVGPYGSSITGLIDSITDENGLLQTYLAVTNPSRNRQGLSTHELSRMFVYGVRSTRNYGQNCANATDNPALVVSHLVGSDFLNPGLVYPQPQAAISRFTALETYGISYVDSCRAGGVTADLGWINGSGQGYASNNRLDGIVSPGSGTGVGGILEYDPYAALPV